MCTSDIFLGLLAILFPPIAVWIKRSICSIDSLLNILLCALGYIPGLLHAWYIIAAYPEPRDDDYDALPGDGGEAAGGAPQQRVTYYYVERRGQQGGEPLRGSGSWGGGGRGYGTTPAERQGEGSSQGQRVEEEQGVPPSYEQAIRGDHKVQT